MFLRTVILRTAEVIYNPISDVDDLQRGIQWLSFDAYQPVLLPDALHASFVHDIGLLPDAFYANFVHDIGDGARMAYLHFYSEQSGLKEFE